MEFARSSFVNCVVFKLIDEEYLSQLSLGSPPYGQIILGYGFNLPNFRFPPRTKITINNQGKIPADHPVIFAMNHTDRFNYFPFLHRLWSIDHPRYTVTWIKGKYYENPILSWIFDLTNNIPLPSLGYLIVKDFIKLIGRKTTDEEYRLIRDFVESNITHDELISNTSGSVEKLLKKPRLDFNPAHENYVNFIHRWHKTLSNLVEKRSLEAIHRYNYNLLVFPEGTRSIKLQNGRTGLVELALKHNLTIVPVGCNGSDEVYTGDSPLASGGEITYRIGNAMRPNREFSDINIDGSYTPFTRETNSQQEKFREATDRVMNAINNLLDERYQSDEDTEHRTSPDRHV